MLVFSISLNIPRMQAVTTKIQFAKRHITLIARLCAISTRHLRVTKRGYVLRHEVSRRRHEIITSNWSSEYGTMVVALVVHKPSTSPHQWSRFEFYSLFFFFFPFPSLSYFQHGCYRRSRLKRPTLCSRSQRPPTSNKRNRRTRYNFHSRKRGRFARVRRCFPDFRLTSVEQRDSRVSSRIDLLIQSVPFHEIYSCSSPSLSNFDAISFEKKKKKERKTERGEEHGTRSGKEEWFIRGRSVTPRVTW